MNAPLRTNPFFARALLFFVIISGFAAPASALVILSEIFYDAEGSDDGHVFVADTDNHRVQVLTKEGAHVRTISSRLGEKLSSIMPSWWHNLPPAVRPFLLHGNRRWPNFRNCGATSVGRRCSNSSPRKTGRRSKRWSANGLRPERQPWTMKPSKSCSTPNNNKRIGQA